MRRPWLLLAPCVALWTGCAGEDAGPPSTLLLTLDTTRADALGCMGYTPTITPALDRLAARGRLYTQAYSVAPLTLPAHASMLTGLYPPRHTLRDNGLWGLPDDARTLAERAHAAGLRTGAFVAAVVLDARYGLDQGFEVYRGPRDDARGTTSHVAARGADAVVDEALAWVTSLGRGERFFLWVHLFDPHEPYQPPPELVRGPGPGEAYLAEVAGMDREIGRLLAGLDLERTVVLAVADHGEGLGDHGERTHGVYCYEPTLRVPFLLCVPGDPRAGERVGAIASVVDVAPTLLDALGLAPLPDVDGRSLLGTDPEPGRGAYFESYSGFLSFGWSPLAGWVDGEGKYVHSSEPQFFEPHVDPSESEDLIAKRIDDVPRYREAIARVLERPRLAADPLAGDAETQADLRALGYVGGGDALQELPDPLESLDLPAPQGRTGILHRTLTAIADFNQGRVPRARRELEAVVAKDPDNWVALDVYALCLMREERLDEAIAILQRLVEARPRRYASHYNLASCLRQAGRVDAALEAYWTAVRLDPSLRQPVDEMVAMLREVARFREAEEVLARWRELSDAARAPDAGD